MTRSKASKVQIVIAHIETDYRPIGTWRVDLGERPKMQACPVAKAMMWLNAGTDKDVTKALAFAAKNPDKNYSVFTYRGERDPLGKAKKDIMEAHNAA